MKAGISFVGALVVVGCAQSPNVDGRPESRRFKNVEEIVIAPRSGLAPVMTGGRIHLPKFPDRMTAKDIESFPVVAYVVDTTGVIEGLAFLNSPPVEMRRAICDWTRSARFEPLHVLGSVRRGLVVSSFAFRMAGSPLSPARPPNDAAAWRSKLEEMSPAEVGSMLEGRPHC